MSESQPDLETLLNNIRQKFLPGGSFASIQDRGEYERQMSALPPGERELAEEVTLYADMCRYFAQKNWEVPPHIRRAVRDVRTLDVPERIETMREINGALMEYLHDISPDSELRM
jgi:hypothetical protein